MERFQRDIKKGILERRGMLLGLKSAWAIDNDISLFWKNDPQWTRFDRKPGDKTVVKSSSIMFITRSKDIRAINHVLLGQGRDIIIYHSKRRKL
jgi:hypothetical protein